MKGALIAITLLVASCGGKEESSSGEGPSEPAGSNKGGKKGEGSGSAKAEGSGSGSAVADAGSGSGSGAATLKADPLPTEIDFEDDSLTKITEKSVETDLKTLEKELDGGGEPKKDEPKKP